MRSSVAGRATAGVAVALILAVGAAGCGSDSVDKGKLASKLSSDPALKSLNKNQLKCVANVVVKYGNKGDIKDYINGKKSASQVKGSDSSKAQQETTACMKKK